MKRVALKINRYLKIINENDIVLDNGRIVRLITQNVVMSKVLFMHLKSKGFLIENKELSKVKSKEYALPLTYYNFDIKRMIASGSYMEVKNEHSKNSDR